MKLLFMGTAAAEAIPALFCRCEVCRRARETGGREIRTRSGALIDGTGLSAFSGEEMAHLRDVLREKIPAVELRGVS